LLAEPGDLSTRAKSVWQTLFAQTKAGAKAMLRIKFARGALAAL